jgi:hypothetical protein
MELPPQASLKAPLVRRSAVVIGTVAGAVAIGWSRSQKQLLLVPLQLELLQILKVHQKKELAMVMDIFYLTGLGWHLREDTEKRNDD